MITMTEAEEIANQYLVELQEAVGDSLQITKNQEESFGWVFFYQSKDYMKTGNFSSMLAGNSPFIVDRKTGELHVLGTAHPADFYINEYCKKNIDG